MLEVTTVTRSSYLVSGVPVYVERVDTWREDGYGTSTETQSTRSSEERQLQQPRRCVVG